MSAPQSTGTSSGRQLPTLLLWAGVALAPLAGLLLWLANGGGPLRAAAVLAVASAVLIGLSVVLRRDTDTIRVEVQDELAAELDAVRAEVREELAVVAQDHSVELRQEVEALQDEVDALREELATRPAPAAETPAQPEPATEQPARHAKPEEEPEPEPRAARHREPEPAPPAPVGDGVYRRTETVRVTRETTVAEEPRGSRHAEPARGGRSTTYGGGGSYDSGAGYGSDDGYGAGTHGRRRAPDDRDWDDDPRYDRRDARRDEDERPRGRYRDDEYSEPPYRADGYRNEGYRDEGYRDDGYRGDYRDDGYRDPQDRGGQYRGNQYRGDGARSRRDWDDPMADREIEDSGTGMSERVSRLAGKISSRAERMGPRGEKLAERLATGRERLQAARDMRREQDEDPLQGLRGGDSEDPWADLRSPEPEDDYDDEPRVRAGRRRAELRVTDEWAEVRPSGPRSRRADRRVERQADYIDHPDYPDESWEEPADRGPVRSTARAALPQKSSEPRWSDYEEPTRVARAEARPADGGTYGSRRSRHQADDRTDQVRASRHGQRDQDEWEQPDRGDRRYFRYEDGAWQRDDEMTSSWRDDEPEQDITGQVRAARHGRAADQDRSDGYHRLPGRPQPNPGRARSRHSRD